ncbi:MAG: hypothetical protein AB7O96_19900 [Pseudobdellovibrionaceae bacterium]
MMRHFLISLLLIPSVAFAKTGKIDDIEVQNLSFAGHAKNVARDFFEVNWKTTSRKVRVLSEKNFKKSENHSSAQYSVWLEGKAVDPVVLKVSIADGTVISLDVDPCKDCTK